jgi:hypothetical protein
MTVTALIGALVALLPPGLLRPQTAPEIERLREEERRARELSNAHANLAIQKLLTAHWRDEAMRLANQNRLEREQWERERDQLVQAALGGQINARLQQQQYSALAQQAQNAQMNAQLAQSALGQQNAAFQGLLGTFGELCNCVPGRHQVFEAERRRVTQV